VDRLWDPEREIFLCRDLRAGGSGADGTGGSDGMGGGLIPERGVSGLVPLLLPELPREIAAALVRTLSGPHFGTGTLLVPSYDLLGEAFDPHRYWRGPAWFNTNWLLESGLRTHGEQRAADALRDSILEVADTSGFAEYVDPYTGEPCGALGFSWTAALALDLLHAPPLSTSLERGDPHPTHHVSCTGIDTFDEMSNEEFRGGNRG